MDGVVSLSAQVDVLLAQINSICPVLKSRISSVKSEIYADCQRSINSLLRSRDALVSQSETLLVESLRCLERHVRTLRTARLELLRSDPSNAIMNQVTDLVTRLPLELLCLENIASTRSALQNPSPAALHRLDTNPPIDTLQCWKLLAAPVPVLPRICTQKADISFWLPERPVHASTNVHTLSKKSETSKDVQVGPTCNETDYHRNSVRPRLSECCSFSACSSLVDKTDTESFEVLGMSPRSGDWLLTKTDFADFAQSAEAPFARRSSDCSLWLAQKTVSSVMKTSSLGTSLMPQSLRSKNTTPWLHKPRLMPEAPRTHDELAAKLASLAERTTADEDKEVDHSELVAMVCCNGSGSVTGVDGGCKPCKSFSECCRAVGEVSPCASRLAEAAKPRLSQWLARQAVLPAALQKNFETLPEDTVPPYLLEMRAIAASDSALWLAAPSTHLKTDNTPRESRWLAPAPQTKTSEAVSEVPTEDLDEEADVDEEEDEEEPGNPEYFTAATRKAKLAHILSEEMSPEAMLEMIPAYPHRHSALSRWLKPKSETP